MRRRLLVASVSALLLLSGSVLYGTGTIDLWQAERSLEQTCGGLPPLAEVQQLLGEKGIRGRPLEPEEYPGLTPLVSCRLAWSGKLPGVELRISKGEINPAVLRDMRHDSLGLPDATSAPFGEGWRGVVTNDLGDFASATVLLNCGAGARDIWVHGWAYAFGSPGFEEKEYRVQLSRVVGSTAASAAEKWDCEPPPSSLPGDAVPTPNGADPVEVVDASGTCAGMAHLADLAEEFGIKKVLETDADSVAPVEDCFLLNSDGEKIYRFTSLYDGLASTYRIVDGIAESSGVADRGVPRWLSSTCPSGVDGFHWLTAVEPEYGNGEMKFQQAALEELAAKSAERKDCAIGE